MASLLRVNKKILERDNSSDEMGHGAIEYVQVMLSTGQTKTTSKGRYHVHERARSRSRQQQHHGRNSATCTSTLQLTPALADRAAESLLRQLQEQCEDHCRNNKTTTHSKHKIRISDAMSFVTLPLKGVVETHFCVDQRNRVWISFAEHKIDELSLLEERENMSAERDNDVTTFRLSDATLEEVTHISQELRAICEHAKLRGVREVNCIADFFCNVLV
jgi:hypothetical protein